jgi:osmotically-inducible protein OsmY
VRADNGVVRLSGFVWDPPDLLEAKSVAELVPGVSSVVNDLELERNGVDNSGVTR